MGPLDNFPIQEDGVNKTGIWIPSLMFSGAKHSFLGVSFLLYTVGEVHAVTAPPSKSSTGMKNQGCQGLHCPLNMVCTKEMKTYLSLIIIAFIFLSNYRKTGRDGQDFFLIPEVISPDMTMN